MPKAQALVSAHAARLEQFKEQGKLLLVGRFEVPTDGAMAVVSDRAAAEEFVKDDPFVLNDVVAKTTYRGWHEIYG